MIAWIKRAAGLLAGLLLFVRFSELEAWMAAAIAVVIALAWSVDFIFPARIRKSAGPLLLVADVLLAAWAAVSGVFTWWLMAAVPLALLCWNAGNFLARWKDPPAGARARYLRSLAVTVGVGSAGGLSAALLEGRFSIGFAASLSLMLLGGVALLRIFRGYR